MLNDNPEAALGHYDELRSGPNRLRPLWQQFSNLTGEAQIAQFAEHDKAIQKAIRHHAISYNVYQDQASVSRAWSLNPVPFLISESDWRHIADAMAQRAALLNQILIDVYSEQRLLKEGLLPAALLQAHPGYLRSMCGVKPLRDLFLPIIAFDIARGPEGQWWVVSQLCQSPSGLGYMLENRHLIAKLFPQAFKGMGIRHLESSYRQLLLDLTRLAAPIAEGEPPRLVLLTSGPWSETYFEHAYLAAYLGLPLVQGADLIAQGDKLYLKTLQGLQRVHGLLRRIDDAFLDPLELRPDSTLGIPGLIQVLREQGVVMANAPGSGFLESPAIQGFLPAIAQALLGETLKMPSLHSWWCGESAALDAIAPLLRTQVVKSSYTGSNVQEFEPIIALHLSKQELAALRERIRQRPEQYTAQTYLPFSQTLTWQPEGFRPKTALVRVFAIADMKSSWQLVPGGMTRIANVDPHVVSIAKGGSTLDTWVQTSKQDAQQAEWSFFPSMEPRLRPVSSRSAEHLFWLGRYSERAEHLSRFAKALLVMSSAEDAIPMVFAKAMTTLASAQALVDRDTPGLSQSPAIFARSLMAKLSDPAACSLEYCLSAIETNLRATRDLFPVDHLRLLNSMREGLKQLDGTLMGSLGGLDELSLQLAALSGLQSDRMTRDLTWRVLVIGRSLERLTALSETLQHLGCEPVLRASHAYETLLNLFDSLITYRVRYQGNYTPAALIELLIHDVTNPRAIAAVIAQTVEAIGWLPKPSAALVAKQQELACAKPAELGLPALGAWAAQCKERGRAISDLITAQYFAHMQAFRTAI